MKKLSLLIALCMLISIGGVYAAWTYSGSTITSKTGMSITKEMGDVEFIGAAGAYTEVSNDLKILVVPKENSYITTLDITGKLVIKFTPHARISQTELNRALNGVITVIGVDLETTKYPADTGTVIYSLVEDPTISTLGQWEEKTDATTGAITHYEFTLTGDKLESIIKIGEFNLPNYDEFLAFQAAHQHAVFKLDINAQPAATT